MAATALTTATAIKQVIESGGLGLAAYRDGAPEDASLPYVVVTDSISVTPELGGDAAESDTEREQVQVDLWETYIDRAANPPSLAEIPSRADDLVRLLHGHALDQAPRKSYGMRVVGRTRHRDVEANTVRNIITVMIRRQT